MYYKTVATLEALQQQRNRDALQLLSFKEALEVCRAAEADTGSTAAKRRAAEDKVWKLLNDASLIRLRYALIYIAEDVVEGTSSEFKPATILSGS